MASNTPDKNSATQPNSGSSRMRPRARIISLLGDELISDEPVAVVELVKNAYDADASTVTIQFKGKNPQDPDTLVVSDDGSGMSLDAVLSAWFEPGTINKKTRIRSPKGRLYQGAKGVGRFAAARLAGSLYMETKEPGKEEGVVVLLDWGKFDEHSYLDEVELDYEVQPLAELVHGTTLTLTDLQARKRWTEEDFRSLHDRLSRLVSPFHDATGNAEIADFRIELIIPSHPELTGTVEPHQLTKRPKYKLAGVVDDAGKFSGSLVIDSEQVRQYEQAPLGAPDESVACGSFEIEIRAWDRDRPGLTPYMLQFNTSMTGVRGILDRYCGVSIYRDGFRVHPYGEHGNDWLSLDTSSRQNPTLRLANNQIIAAVRISRTDNPELKDRTTREGLVHNAAYDALIDWFGRILALLEEERYRVRPREESKSEEVSTLFEVFDMSEVVEQADKKLGKSHPVAALVRKKDSEIREGVRKLQEHYSRVMMLAGFGQLVDIVVHEIGAPKGRIDRGLSHLEKSLQDSLGPDLPSPIAEHFRNLRAWLTQIGTLREKLMPKTAARRGRATTFDVADEIRGNFALFESLISKQNLQTTLRAPKKPVIVHMSRSALGQVIANLMDNSIFWLSRHHGDGLGGNIDVRLTSQEHSFTITFCDDGPGVEPEDRDRIFDMNFSRKPNGTGLGLFIARQVIENYGRLIYKDDCKLSGACFQAEFERNVGL